MTRGEGGSEVPFCAGLSAKIAGSCSIQACFLTAALCFLPRQKLHARVACVVSRCQPGPKP